MVLLTTNTTNYTGPTTVTGGSFLDLGAIPIANIGGGKTSRAAEVTATASDGALPRAPAAAEMARVGGRAGAREVFGELELDEYGDIHVLSRSLAEIGNDFEEAFRTLSSELSSFAEDADSLGGIISGIQGEVTRARMVPLDAVFTRLRFPIRDAATRDVKDVHVVTEGADVNIDKTIADAILQPMLHLVRNAVAHGIESPARRASLGKERFGTIRLIARQQSGQIVIEVADDGAGLDLAALRARGIAQGLITTDVTVDDPRVKELVFASGLSTRDVASDIAGRGVGGEVVKRTIERLNGGIRIESTRGKGTSFVITLPLTLAITRALLVSEGQATYAVPLYFAERILDAESLEIAQTGNERRVLLDGTYTRVRRLDEYFGGSAAGRTGGPALVLRVGDERMVLQVDAVLGQEEIVVKRAGELLEGHPLFAGVTLRGTGDLVLIVDVPGLLGEFARVRPTDDVAGPMLGITVAAAPAPSARRRPEDPSLTPKSPPKLPSKATKATKGAKPAGGAEPGLTLPVARVAFPSTQPLVGVRALVVDDSLSVRKVAEAHLRGLGVEVVVAVDGVDGLAKLREGRFDVVFTDLEMPRMHGYDFVRQLRMLAAYQSLPVVVVSSRSGQKHQDHARSVGATDYITKPFSAQSLEATIRKWLRG
jgi:chemosensory pili system protein ChpA (sensor histidine kinase/response regulator)